MLMKTGILYFKTCFHGFSILRHPDPFVRMLHKCVGILKKARPCLTRKCLLDLYYSFAFPYLIYCVEIWGDAGDRLLNPLFLVQKKIVRIIV